MNGHQQGGSVTGGIRASPSTISLDARLGSLGFNTNEELPSSSSVVEEGECMQEDDDEIMAELTEGLPR